MFKDQISVSKSEIIETNWSRDGLRLKNDNWRRGCRLQDSLPVEVTNESPLTAKRDEEIYMAWSESMAKVHYVPWKTFLWRHPIHSATLAF